MYTELSGQQKAMGQKHGIYCKCLNEGNKLLKVLVQGQGHKSSSGIYFLAVLVTPSAFSQYVLR